MMLLLLIREAINYSDNWNFRKKLAKRLVKRLEIILIALDISCDANNKFSAQIQPMGHQHSRD
jgi:hypothetical protein